MKISPRIAISCVSFLTCFLTLTLAAMAQAPNDRAEGVYLGEARLTFTTIDVPGALGTSVNGINTAGETVGYYYTSTTGPATGFLHVNGTFSFFSYPGGDSTLAFGINDSGLISGTAYINQDTGSVGFLYNGATFVPISVKGESATFVHGINNAGNVVGAYGSFEATKAFELVGTRFHTIAPPGVPFLVFGDGINSLGEVVGSATASSETGWAYRQGKFQTLTVPGSSEYTVAWGVNDSGIVVGFYTACTPGCYNHGFALRSGRYLSLDYPGAVETYADGVNGSGQIVGSYTFDQQTYHGYVTSPITAADFEER